MNLKYTLAVIFASAAGFAGAADVFHPSNDETGTVNHAIPGTAARIERRAPDQPGTLSADKQWVFMGEEAGWAPQLHGFMLEEGRVVHNDPFSHDAPKPQLDSIAASTYRALERD